MRKTILTTAAFAAFAFVLSAGTAQAQTARPHGGPDAEARREFLKEHKGELKAKWESLTPDQKAAFKANFKAYQDERKSLMAQVKAGTLDKKSAADQLKAWREAHKPTT